MHALQGKTVSQIKKTKSDNKQYETARFQIKNVLSDFRKGEGISAPLTFKKTKGKAKCEHQSVNRVALAAENVFRIFPLGFVESLEVGKVSRLR